MIRSTVQPKEVSLDRPLVMAVQRVRRTESGEALAMGMVFAGELRPGDPVWIYGYRAEPLEAVAEEIRIGDKITDQAFSGDHVSVRLTGVRKEDLRVGQMMVAPGRTMPGSGKLTRRLSASVHVFTREEGGRHTPFFNGYTPHMILGHAKTAATIRLLNVDEVPFITPGSSFSAELELEKPVIVKPWMRITMWDNGTLFAAGQVTDVE